MPKVKKEGTKYASKYARKASVDRELSKLKPHMSLFIDYCIGEGISKTSSQSYIRNLVSSIGPQEWHSQIRKKDPHHVGHSSFKRWNFLKEQRPAILSRLMTKVEEQRKGVKPDPVSGCIVYTGSCRPQVNIDKADLADLNSMREEHFPDEPLFTGKVASARVVALLALETPIGDKDWKASHLCHDGYCIAGGHIELESDEIHGRRSVCKNRGHCVCCNVKKCFPKL